MRQKGQQQQRKLIGDLPPYRNRALIVRNFNLSISALVIALLGLGLGVGLAAWNGVQQKQIANQAAAEAVARSQMDDQIMLNMIQQMAIDTLIMPLLNNETADNIIEGTYTATGNSRRFLPPLVPPFSGANPWSPDSVWNNALIATGTCRMLEFIIGGVRYGVHQYDVMGPSIPLGEESNRLLTVSMSRCTAQRPEATTLFGRTIENFVVTNTAFTPPVVSLPPHPKSPTGVGGLMEYHDFSDFFFMPTHPCVTTAVPMCFEAPAGSTWSMTQSFQYLEQLSIA
jgi:hypothetical protein